MASADTEKPVRRSDTILQTRRVPLPWPDGEIFRILSLDGGGIKGIFPAGVLTYLEENCLGGKSVGDYFDLITGTSTGGIIALGLGAGLSARYMMDLYVSEGHRVFPPAQRGKSRRLWKPGPPEPLRPDGAGRNARSDFGRQETAGFQVPPSHTGNRGKTR